MIIISLDSSQNMKIETEVSGKIQDGKSKKKERGKISVHTFFSVNLYFASIERQFNVLK